MNKAVQIPRPGPLVAIGGAEDKTSETIILKRVLGMAPSDAPVVGVITTASSVPQDVFDGYEEAFMRLGAEEVRDVRIRQRAEADDARFVDMLDGCDVIFISGGDQMRLTNVLGASKSLECIRARRKAGAVIAGTSAGAACQSSTMVYGGPADDSLRKGAVKMSSGFGFASGVIIDTHFLERGRFSRLMEVGAANPSDIGIGLGEDAAIVFLSDDTIEAFGPGHVVVIDSSKISGSNVFDLDDGEAVYVSNVVMHALVDGYGFSLSDRQVLTPEELRARKPELRIAYT